MKKVLIIFTLFTMTYASNENPTNNSYDLSMKEIAYVNMSTKELQEEVEKRSINGDLSFDMGLELIKRWTNS